MSIVIVVVDLIMEKMREFDRGVVDCCGARESPRCGDFEKQRDPPLPLFLRIGVQFVCCCCMKITFEKKVRIFSIRLK